MAIYTDIEDQNLTQEEQNYFGNANYFTSSGDVMAGLVYERLIYTQYKELNMVPAGFAPPQAGGHGKDFEFFIRNYNSMIPNNSTSGGMGMIVGVELKLSDTDDYGQSGLRYDGSWVLHGGMNQIATEKRKLLKAAGVEQVIRNRWNPKGIPNIRAGVYSTQVSEAKRQEDKNRFKSFDFKSNAFVNLCAKYYLSKQCPYINISSHGLYHFGTDPAGLAKEFGVKNFTTAVKGMVCRVRLKQSGKNSLTYNVSLKIDTDAGITKSPVNLNDTILSEELQEDAMACTNAPNNLALLKALL